MIAIAKTPRELSATALVGELLPFPYIPANEHKPALVSMWFADTLLSPRKLTAFLGNPSKLRSMPATEVNLVPWLTAFEENTNRLSFAEKE
ncbi:hypothetical protein [Achromobacter sp. SLBN-14]|uniref:hypothetical protein n=1 Tax=Achromobacter sp. SLBN-14 TaxID=2768442 RepID=UPI00114F7CD8|nr:hypothetical protein [Achromobacter sp. SLBN-14]TQJ96050.1 hypothetical protein FBY20_2824 [Achromobacter sp. SLBN-14]